MGRRTGPVVAAGRGARDFGGAACYAARVDPKAHKRFLEYVEKFQYFGGGKKRLTREQWEALDAERGPLEAEAAAERISAEGLTRLLAIRRLLLVD